MKPLVSILIPAYNAEICIADALRCAISQTWDRKEIIVIDDGSKDRTLEIARQFESAQVKVLTQKNQGASATRNNAFALSRGDYVQWFDADDLMAPDKIASQMQAAQKCADNRKLISGAWARFIHRPYRAQFRPGPLWQDLSREEWLMRKLENNTYMQTATWLVSRELAESAGQWDTRLLGDDDGEFFCRVLLESNGTQFVKESRVFYRASGANSLSYIGHSDRKLEAQWLSMQLHVRYLRSLIDDARARAACVTYLQNWMFFFYPQRIDIFEQAQALAKSLGGDLKVPEFSWKYAWISAIVGRTQARRAQVFLPRLKWSVVRKIDKTMKRIENRDILGSLSR